MSYDYFIQMIPRYQNDTGTLLFHHIHRKYDHCQRIERVTSESMTPVSELGESAAKLIWHGTDSETQRFAHFADKFAELSSFPICGCDKLSEWGFKIYGCIDAYSWNIAWMYVGISNRTAESVLWQYLITCSSLGFQPKIIRSDRGKETLLYAEVHFAFAHTIQEDPNFKVGDCWFYGTSTGNQRIES